MTIELPEPHFAESDLGRSIPDTPHALSVCMPLWKHNVGYEEGDQNVVSLFQSGYPRFFMNPLVSKLRDQVADDLSVSPEQCLILPTECAAQRCAAYVTHRTNAVAQASASSTGVFAVTTNESGSSSLAEFWQHAGEIVASRSAACCLEGSKASITNSAAKQTLRERVAQLQDVAAEDVYLFPSGMAAIYTAWRATQSVRPGPAAQFGFPYVDTFKILERFGQQPPWFFPVGSEEELQTFGSQLQTDSLSALFCEAPGNPLLKTPPLKKLTQLAAEYGFIRVVDDTLGAMVNLDIKPHADLIATSLSKFFSGGGDVIAGSLTVTPGPHYDTLKQFLEADFVDAFCDEDAEVLEQNSREIETRITKINASANELAAVLHDHPAVAEVFYPAITSREQYDSVRRPNGGYGGLLSVELKNAQVDGPRAYDRLRVWKGPNLGTNFTLCCPYTILAHYEELDFAQRCGVSPYLLRISVGLEGTDWIKDRVLSAIAHADESACQ